MARSYIIEHQDTVTGLWRPFWWSGQPSMNEARARFAEYMPKLYPEMQPLLIAVCQARARQLLVNQEMEVKDKKFRMKIYRRG